MADVAANATGDRFLAQDAPKPLNRFFIPRRTEERGRLIKIELDHLGGNIDSK